MYIIHHLLEKDKQDQARKYEKERRLIGLLDSLISLIIILLFYFSGLSKQLANLLPESSAIWAFCIYIFSFTLLTFLIGLPTGYYSGYKREHFWGFSNQTVKSWLWDQLKSLMVGLVISLILLGLLFLIMSLWPQNWWLIAAIAVALVSIIFATIFPVIIMPLFNKYSPIETGELTERLSSLLQRTGLKASGFFMEDMSKQTKKENAFLGGLGRTRRVVLGDNLINNMSTAEIESVIAH
ncbi:MAG: M48 family metalloprotease, partial [Candidatus Marinimicrobia bacterium]|nr:M48 family metalloprotease [Candidatus Neomarinimicrobiota bacterium]